MDKKIKVEKKINNMIIDYNDFDIAEWIKIKNGSQLTENIKQKMDKFETKINIDAFWILREKLKGRSDFYGRIIDIQDRIVKVSAATKYMIEFDDVFLGNIKNGIYYRAIELLQKEEDIEETIVEINKGLNRLREDEYIDPGSFKSKEMRFWLVSVIRQISKPYFFELYIDNDKKIPWEKYDIGKYYKFKANKENIAQNEYECSALEVFSASPIIRKGRTLIITEEIIDQNISERIENNWAAYKNYKQEIGSNKIKDLEKRIKDTLPESIESAIYRVNHVGQGLNSYLKLNNKTGIAFDLGDSYYKSDGEFQKIDMTLKLGKRKYKKNKPKIVILSHWDTDHILAIAECDISIYDAIWIVPSSEEIGVSNAARNLQKYLAIDEFRKFSEQYYYWIISNEFNKKMVVSNAARNLQKYRAIDEFRKSSEQYYYWIISNEFNKKMVVSIELENFELNIYKSSGKKNHVTKDNNIGLVMEVNTDKKLLVMGDSDYEERSEFKNDDLQFNYLIASHHGGKSGSCSVKLENNAKVIVPVGKNTYGHPVYENNLDNLIKSGSGKSIIETQHSGDIELKLK